jgi:hypothetical protein
MRGVAEMIDFQNGEQAARWLLGRLRKLERSVDDAPELARLLEAGARDVLVDVETDPQLFTRDAAERLRRFTSQVSRATLERAQREGFQRDVLDRYALDLVAEDVERARDVLSGMSRALRERIEALSGEAGAQHGGGQAAFADLVGRVSVALQAALKRWHESGPGRHRRSILPWRRRKARRLRPLDDQTFQVDVAASTRRLRGELEAAARAVGVASRGLTLAKYYSDIVTVLGHHAAVAGNLADVGRPVAARAERRLAELRRRAEERDVPRSTDRTLLDDGMLDAVLDQLGVDAGSFLATIGPDLDRVSERELDERVREWASSQLSHVAAPTLADAFGGMASDAQQARRRLVELLAQGQPLVRFDDAIASRLPDGAPAQYYVMAEASDGSIRALLTDACHQLGLPTPRLEVVPPDVDDEGDGQLSLRIMQFVAGIPFFAQVDRLLPLIRTHRETMAGGTGQRLGDTELATALRDLRISDELPDLLPAAVQQAVDRRLELEAGDDEDGEPDRQVTPFPVSGSGNARG